MAVGTRASFRLRENPFPVRRVELRVVASAWESVHTPPPRGQLVACGPMATQKQAPILDLWWARRG